MLYRIICTLFLVNVSVLFTLSQGTVDSNLVELINISDFRIIDKTTENQKALKFSHFYKLIEDDWHSEVYLNEYDDENETRFYRGKSFLHKEALELNFLGNSEIIDDSIILVDNHDVQFSVGMPVSTIRKNYPISYSRSQDYTNNENKDLKKMFLISAYKYNGQIFPSDLFLTFVYNNVSGKVERIYSR